MGPLPTPPSFSGSNYGPPPIPPRTGAQCAQGGAGSGPQASEAQNNHNNQIYHGLHIQVPQAPPAQVHPQAQPVSPAPAQPDHPAHQTRSEATAQPVQVTQEEQAVQTQHNWEAVEDGDPDEPPPPPYSETAANGEQVLDELHDSPQAPHVQAQLATQPVPALQIPSGPQFQAPQSPHDHYSPHVPQAPTPVSPGHAHGGTPLPHIPHVPRVPSMPPMPPMPAVPQLSQPQPEGRRLGYLNLANSHWSESLAPIDRRQQR